MSKTLTVKDPYSGETLKELAFASQEDARKALDRAKQAFSGWRFSAAWERAEVLLTVASELEKRRSEFAQLMTREAGKPMTFTQVEIDRALGTLRWAAAEAQRFSGELIRTDAMRSGRQGFGIHQRFPRGVILGITPFNFPLNLVCHKVAPAIASGCTILVKPSPATPLTALLLMELFEKARPGLMQVLMADDSLTESLTRSSEIAMVSFTGSARVGKLIQQQACDKPVVLELGGNAWCVVMEDVPASVLPAIARKISGAAYGYAGQSCISVQNVAVAGSLWNETQKHLRGATETFAYGAPDSGEALSGPLINAAASSRVRGELDKAAQARAETIRSVRNVGKIQDGSGNLVAPSLVLTPDEVTRVPEQIRSLQQEEIFAPVMMAGRFGQLDELIRLINSSKYGLQTGVFTRNLEVAERLYRELDVGGVMINDVPSARYDHQPYGGVKDSGHGREGLRYAMEEMTYSKFLSLSSQFPG